MQLQRLASLICRAGWQAGDPSGWYSNSGATRQGEPVLQVVCEDRKFSKCWEGWSFCSVWAFN